MTQNTSSAVMAQRAEPNDSLDDFPTQPWGTRALMEHIIKPRFDRGLGLGNCWEPAANRGYMVRPLQEYFDEVHASDVHDYGCGYYVSDFLWPASFPNGRFAAPEFIISNPPFRLAEQFIARARQIATVGCAMLVRTSFLEGVGRYERLYSLAPPTIVAQFTERLPMVKGRVDPKVSTATSYAWLLWIKDAEPEPFRWISPSRHRLEMPGDYA